MLPNSFLEQLKDSSPIEGVVSSYVELKPIGGSKQIGLCPFHAEKSPSFVVYSSTQSFYCFGCRTGGDVISFIKKIENLDYMGALKVLANRAGIAIPAVEQTDSSNLNAAILRANKEAAKFFHETLKKTDRAMDYLQRERGIRPEIIKKFGLGFSPESWDALGQHLRNLGFSTKELLESKLLAKGKNNSVYDVFRNRIMFPIMNSRFEVIAFGGRVLNEGQPKYLNSYDSPVFKKSNSLFNINLAKNNLAKNNKQIILVEGYLDVISVVQAGFENVVATLGVALTTNQAKLLSVYADVVILAYDSDKAGQAATLKAIDILEIAGIDVKVLDLSGCKDPDEYIKKRGAIRFKDAIFSSVAALDFKLNKLKSEFDVDTTSGKASFLKAATELLSNVQSKISREVYLSKICSELNVDKQAIASHVGNLIKTRIKKGVQKEQKDIRRNLTAKSQIGQSQAKVPVNCIKSEELIIRSLYGNPDLFEMLKANCPPEIFVSPNKEIYVLLLDRLEKGLQLHISCITEKGSATLARLSEILAQNFDLQLDRNGILECVETLQKQKRKKEAADILKMNAEELRKYMNDISNYKKC